MNCIKMTKGEKKILAEIKPKFNTPDLLKAENLVVNFILKLKSISSATKAESWITATWPPSKDLNTTGIIVPSFMR